MTEPNGQQPETPPGPVPDLPGPAVVEYGRYKVFESPDGLVIARTVDTCDRCQECGCGDRAEPLNLPDPRRGTAQLMAWLAKNANTGLLGNLKAMMTRGS